MDTNTTITSPKGFKSAGVACGLKESGKRDLGIIVSDVKLASAGVFTTNKVLAAPVIVSRERLKKNGFTRGIVVNSGNANACTGTQGLENARKMRSYLASKIGCVEDEILVASTGIIGRQLDMDKIEVGINLAYNELADTPTAGENFAQAILTTDTKTKSSYYEIEFDGKKVKIAGVAKGAGMIAPNLATMLGFITTDIKIRPDDLKSLLAGVVDKTFNRITVDGDMSTNDSVFAFASGLSGVDFEDIADKFKKGLFTICSELALKIVADGEGATKIFHVKVINASSDNDAHNIARAVAESLLVKTAIHGADPNWGRIISAAGAKANRFDPEKVICKINDITIFANGMGVDFDEETIRTEMKKNELWITLDLNDGEFSDTVHSSDLSKEYIEINAFYHT